MKYLCLLVPQTGMAHLRLDLFLMNKDMRYMPTGTFYSHWAFRKKSKGRGIKDIFLKNHGVIKNIFLRKTPEFLSLFLYPWKFWTKETFTPRNSIKLCYRPRKSPIFS